MLIFIAKNAIHLFDHLHFCQSVFRHFNAGSLKGAVGNFYSPLRIYVS